MKRLTVRPREDWQEIVENQGLIYHHHPNGSLYWDESAYYSFSSSEIDVLDDAAEEMYALCIDAVKHIISSQDYSGFDLPYTAIKAVETSWNRQDPTIYGRFDFAYNGIDPPKLLEFNADTPTSLLEASVIQWFWLNDVFPHSDQFNSIHEKLIEGWHKAGSQVQSPVYFSCVRDEAGEEVITTTYLRDTAEEAGLKTKPILIPDIGWNHTKRTFVDLANNEIKSIFKLYPWEWMVTEKFAGALYDCYSSMIWLEPIWKMLLSNKNILSLLWQRNPGHPNLLETYTGSSRNLNEFVSKPVTGREGEAVSIHSGSRSAAHRGFVFQQHVPLREYNGKFPVIGNWIIDGKSAGMGIRESSSPITDDVSSFIPHVID